ncbi:MAG: hypothetical protein D6679_11150 [Candidatus Hydrogenedentota bacterium]|nr:MAG: hypothetical protein D6679_11150 [Candidatus Hydrogenedentota bacterium]
MPGSKRRRSGPDNETAVVGIDGRRLFIPISSISPLPFDFPLFVDFDDPHVGPLRAEGFRPTRRDVASLGGDGNVNQCIILISAIGLGPEHVAVFVQFDCDRIPLVVSAVSIGPPDGDEVSAGILHDILEFLRVFSTVERQPSLIRLRSVPTPAFRRPYIGNHSRGTGRLYAPPAFRRTTSSGEKKDGDKRSEEEKCFPGRMFSGHGEPPLSPYFTSWKGVVDFPFTTTIPGSKTFCERRCSFRPERERKRKRKRKRGNRGPQESRTEHAHFLYVIATVLLRHPASLR